MAPRKAKCEMRNDKDDFHQKNTGKITTAKIYHLSLLEHNCNKTPMVRYTHLHPQQRLPNRAAVSPGVSQHQIEHTMLNKYTVQLMALGIVGSLGATAFADDSALIDALVKKGVLKTKEAEQIRAEAAKGSHQGSGGKLNLDSSVKSLSLSGDIRARYNYTSGTGVNPFSGGQGILPGPDAHTQQQSFYDLRVRINADFKLSDDFYAGVGLRTQRDARNDNALMGNNSADFGVGLYRAFLGWNPVDGVALIAGKQKVPFYTTDLVWDADINPVGFSERIDLNKTFGLSGFDLSLVSGQFVLNDNDESQDITAASNRDSFLWQTQLVAGIDLGGAKLTFAPGYLSTNGTDDGTGTLYTKDVQVLLLPGDISGDVAGIKAKFEWDLAYNIAGDDRALNYAQGANTISAASSRSSDQLAWLLGIRLGENKKKGDLSAQVNYRRTGAGALPHLQSDNEFAFGDSRNMGGFKVGAAYSLSDSSYFGLNYLKFERVRSQGDQANIGFATGEWLQAEVGVKF